jgi:hypothetical protein
MRRLVSGGSLPQIRRLLDNILMPPLKDAPRQNWFGEVRK